MPRKKRRRLSTARSKVRSIKGGRGLKRVKVQKNGKSFRDIVKDGVTYSFLSEFFGTCREQARLSYVEGYGQAGVCDALEFGQLFHSCCEASAAAGNCAISSYKVTADYIAQKLKREKIAKKSIEELKVLARIVSVLYPAYWGHWQRHEGLEFQGNTKFIAQEKAFTIKHELPSGNVIPIRGRFDAILRKGNGKLWLMENKTKSRIDAEGLTSVLSSMDLQTMLYCLAIRKEYGETPEGVLYNVIKKPGLRQKIGETTEEYLARIQQDVEDKPNDYFMRWHVAIREKDLLDWEARSLNPMLEQVWVWWDSIKQNPLDPWKSPHHFINPEGLYTRYGKSRYFDLLTRGAPVGLVKREPYVAPTSPPEKKSKKRKVTKK